MSDLVNVIISSPLEPKHVERIAAVDPRVQVLYAPELLPVPRYEADHTGVPPRLTPEQDRRWLDLAAQAEVSFDFDRRAPEQMGAHFPRLRWLQATSAGLGRFQDRYPLDLDRVTVTTAAGIHAGPLAEFTLAGLLYFVKDFPALRRWQALHRWTRYTGRGLAGQRVLVVGLGNVGRRIAGALSGLGVEVVGAVRPGGTASAPGVSSAVPFDALREVLPQMDAIVLACPLTAQTRGLIDAACFAALRPGTLLVNVARGEVVDEEAMIEALRDGRLGGAVLDVTAVEPLPVNSPLWEMEQVVISPHSASTVAEENGLITDLFCDNLRRWLDGRPLINVYRPELGY